MERKKLEKLLKKNKKANGTSLGVMSENELKRLLLQTQKAIKKLEKEQFKTMDELNQIGLEKRKREKLRAHFKILAGGLILSHLTDFNLDYYVELPRPDRRKKGPQPPNPDEIFIRDFCKKIGLKSGLPTKKN